MFDISMCRLCLASDVHLHAIMGTPLQDIFEKLTNISLSSEDGKPLLACYICYSQLKKCHIIMRKAVNADALLNELLHHGVITNNSVSEQDRQLYNLIIGLTITQTVSVAIEDMATVRAKRELVVKTEAIEVPVKVEMECDGEASDTDNHDSGLHIFQPSDSDDDLPLKSISTKTRPVRAKNTRVRVRKKRQDNGRAETGPITDFAREIILSKDQQQQELLDRSKSLNYLNSPLKCELCYKGFVDNKAFENHKEKHDEKSGPHECEVCRMRYYTERQLRTHTATSHSRRYACDKCEHSSHTANQAREHEKWHSGYTYECTLCGQKFRKPTSYLTHMRKRHPTEHVCDLCGDSFVGQHGLTMHRAKTHHRDGKRPENASEPPSERFCAECNIQFMSKDAWKRHILSSAKHTLDNENSPQCRLCDARFPSSAGLSAHLREHERALRAARTSRAAKGKITAKLTCEQCGGHFNDRSKLHAHVKRMHLGLKYNKNIVCEVCGQKCTSNASLKYHQRTHTGERPYQCSACDKRFSDRNQLRIHTRTHTGERPYCCTVCGKRFSQKPALNRHYRVHTGAKPYTCTYCAKTFSQSNSMKLHVRAIHLKMPPNNRKNKAQNVIAVEKVDVTVLQDL